MSHTPGPWEIMESANAIVVMGADSQHVVIVPLHREYAWNKEEWEGLNLEEKNKVSKANARLIAAAPELYGALFELWDKVWRIVDLHRDSEARAEANMALERANTALTKAQGEEGEEDA